MLDDLTKSIKASLYERASSPLLSAFILSWVIWNYRFLVVVLSSLSASEKFALIDLKIFPSVYEASTRGLLFPLVTALALIFLYPFPARFVYRFHRTRLKELKAIQQQIEDETPMTQAEAVKLRRQVLRAGIEYDALYEKQTAEVKQLKELITSLQGELDNARSLLPKADYSEKNNDEMRKAIEVEANEKIEKAMVEFVRNDPVLKDKVVRVLVGRSVVSVTFSAMGALINREYPFSLQQGRSVQETIYMLKTQISKDSPQF